VGIICPPPVGIGLTDRPNIGGGAVVPLDPPVPASLNKVCVLNLVVVIHCRPDSAQCKISNKYSNVT